MNNRNNNTQTILRTLATKMIDRDTYEWPPKCSFLTYQPQRPARAANADSKKVDNK